MSSIELRIFGEILSNIESEFDQAHGVEHKVKEQSKIDMR